MTMAGREARMLDAVYRTYGRSARWAPSGGGDTLTPVVRHELRDEIEGFGQGQALNRTNLIFVRCSAFPTGQEPAQADIVEIDRDAGGVDTFRIRASPRLEDGALEWLCEAVAL